MFVNKIFSVIVSMLLTTKFFFLKFFRFSHQLTDFVQYSFYDINVVRLYANPL